MGSGHRKTASLSRPRDPGLPRAARIGGLIAAAAGFALAAFLLPPFAQPLEYHAFADARRILGIPNFWDVTSNLPFLCIGLAGLAFLLRDPRARMAFQAPLEKWTYAVFFTGVTLSGIGSAFYHLAPDNARLVWDRLPLSIAFMSLTAAMVVERVDRIAGLRLLAPLVATGIASVAYWHFSAVWGAENMQPYIAAQLGAIVGVLLIAALFPSRYARGNEIYAVVMLYGVAKLAEYLDQAIFELGAILSGHSLKHLVAAGAVYAVLGMLKRRSAIPGVAVTGVE